MVEGKQQREWSRESGNWESVKGKLAKRERVGNDLQNKDGQKRLGKRG